MCPNCILNQAGLSGGLYVAFGVCALFFVVAVLGMIWAFRNGEFEDMEGSKFDILDESQDASVLRGKKSVAKS